MAYTGFSLGTHGMVEAKAALIEQDRALIDRLLLPETQPTDDNLVVAARLFSRYLGSTQEELVADLSQAMENWGFTITDTQSKARAIWQNGYRPQAPASIDVGSGADSNNE